MKKILLIFTLLMVYNKVVSPEKSFMDLPNSASLFVVTDKFDEVLMKHSRIINDDTILSQTDNQIINRELSYHVVTNQLNHLQDRLPAWHKNECLGVTSNNGEDNRMLNVFANGFYYSNESHHKLRYKLKKVSEFLYNVKFDANIVGQLFWKKKGKYNDLKECYDFVEESPKD